MEIECLSNDLDKIFAKLLFPVPLSQYYQRICDLVGYHINVLLVDFEFYRFCQMRLEITENSQSANVGWVMSCEILVSNLYV